METIVAYGNQSSGRSSLLLVGCIGVIGVLLVAVVAGGFLLLYDGGSDEGGSSETEATEVDNGDGDNGDGDDDGGDGSGGEPVQAGNLQYELVATEAGIESVEGVSETYFPEEGEFLQYELAIENTGSAESQYSPVPQRLFDDAGQEYSHHIEATVAVDDASDSTLAPGDVATSYIVFDVPPDAAASHLELVDGYDPDTAARLDL